MNSKRYRIVCVDDDLDTRDLLEAWLEFADFEYEVEAAGDSEAALELVGRRDADLYVLDSSVRGEEPITLLQTIRDKDKTTPILVFSGLVKKIDRDEAFAAGANEHLSKPADSEDFIAAVERLLKQR